MLVKGRWFQYYHGCDGLPEDIERQVGKIKLGKKIQPVQAENPFSLNGRVARFSFRHNISLKVESPLHNDLIPCFRQISVPKPAVGKTPFSGNPFSSQTGGKSVKMLALETLAFLPSKTLPVCTLITPRRATAGK